LGVAARLDFAKCLAKIREMQSDVYIPLSKAAKALGLVQSSHFSYQTIENLHGDESQDMTLANGDIHERLAEMIKKDFHGW